MDSLDISKEIRARRLACQLTQAEAAEAAGVSRITIQQWERGVRAPMAEPYLRFMSATAPLLLQSTAERKGRDAPRERELKKRERGTKREAKLPRK